MNQFEVNEIFQIGNSLANVGRYEQAAERYRQVIVLAPQFAMAHNNLGVMLAEIHRLPEAIESYRRAIAIEPGYSEAHYNLANAFKDLDRFKEAIAHYRLSISSNSKFASAYNNLAIALMAMGEMQEAVGQFQSALQIQPEMSIAHSGLGLALSHLGKHDEALEAMNRALEIAPSLAEAHYNRGLNLLLQGEFRMGWQEYEWRWKLPESPPRTFPKPLWQGESLAGKTILLHTEQGIGDSIQFVRFALRLQGLGARVILECQSHCRHIFECVQGIDLIVAGGLSQPPEFDVHCPMMSLGKYLVRDATDAQCSQPYIHPLPDLVAHWKHRVAAIDGFRIGIAWQGSRGYRWDHLRSIALREFEPLSKIPGVQLIGLQKGVGSEQLDNCPFRVHDFGSQLDNDGQAFADTMALLPSLDCVVSSDSAIVHLAGAMGIRTCVLLPIGPDWRWHLGSDESPWYPNMRLYRQSRYNDWSTVMETVAHDLRVFIGQRS